MNIYNSSLLFICLSFRSSCLQFWLCQLDDQRSTSCYTPLSVGIPGQSNCLPLGGEKSAWQVPGNSPTWSPNTLSSMSSWNLSSPSSTHLSLNLPSSIGNINWTNLNSMATTATNSASTTATTVSTTTSSQNSNTTATTTTTTATRDKDWQTIASPRKLILSEALTNFHWDKTLWSKSNNGLSSLYSTDNVQDTSLDPTKSTITTASITTTTTTTTSAGTKAATETATTTTTTEEAIAAKKLWSTSNDMVQKYSFAEFIKNTTDMNAWKEDKPDNDHDNSFAKNGTEVLDYVPTTSSFHKHHNVTSETSQSGSSNDTKCSDSSSAPKSINNCNNNSDNSNIGNSNSSNLTNSSDNRKSRKNVKGDQISVSLVKNIIATISSIIIRLLYN